MNAPSLSRPAISAPSQPGHWTSTRKSQAAAALEVAADEIWLQLQGAPLLWRSKGRRHVALWNAVEWSVRDDGTDFRCRPIDASGEFFHPTSDLFTPVSALRWPLAFSGALGRGCDAVGLRREVLPGPTGDWMRQALRRAFKAAVPWNDLRRAILHALALDPLTLTLHSRVFDGGHCALETFNWVNLHQRELALVAIERPKLLPFFSLVRGEGAPLQALERRLREAGMSPAVRAWMEKVGFAAFQQATEYGFIEDWPLVITRYASLLARLRIASPEPVFTAAATTLGASVPDWFYRALQREVQRLVEEGVEEGDAWPADYEIVARWARTTAPEPDANQRRSGWAWMRARAIEARIDQATSARETWAVPCLAFQHEGLAVVPLESLDALRDEARAMRNCLENYAIDCLEGEALPFSIRTAAGERVACFMLVRVGALGRWEVEQVAGVFNMPASEEATAAAALACEKCNQREAEIRRAKARAAKQAASGAR